MYTIDSIDKTNKGSDTALREDLERRYGPAMAQDILDQLKKAEGVCGPKSAPDYLSVKTLSEGEEMYRRDAQEALKRLKAWKPA